MTSAGYKIRGHKMASSPRLIHGCLMCVASFFIFGGLLAPMNSYGRLFTGLQDDLNITAVEAGVLLFMGFFCGSTSGVCIHSILCVLFKYFSSSAQTRAAGIPSAGGAMAVVLVTIAYEKFIPIYGWRFTIQMTSVFAAIFAIPASFLISLNEKHFRRISLEEDKTNGSLKNIQKLHQEEEAEEEHPMRPKNTPYDVIIYEERNSWMRLLTFWRAWLIFGALMLPAMSWSVFWVNVISYFESIAMIEGDILLYVTIMTVSDVCGKLFLVFFMNKLPWKEVNLLTTTNFIMAVVSVLFVVCPVKIVLSICCLFIGVFRGWYNTLPYRAAVTLLEADNSDQGITLAMLSLGIGFTIGTLPAGAIYDATGSYTYAFIINALLYLIGGLMLVLLHAHKRMRRRKLTRCNQHIGAVQFALMKETNV
ncbi:uncharacterized protein [Apostichopus japonicus]|uniref:uncharacterized protein isoform X2 n=1 Tax=Stichopus japonicus TaxID=307972 RepID=UPI003AB44375